MKNTFKNKLLLLMFIIVGGFYSCETLVNNVPPNRLPKAGKKMVVNGFISPQMDTVRVSVSESQPIFTQTPQQANGQDTFISDAKVSITSEGKTIDLKYHSRSNSYFFKPSVQGMLIKNGVTYNLTVSRNGQTVTSSATVPQTPVAITETVIDTITTKASGFSQQRLTVKSKVSWNDPANEENYYFVKGSIVYENKFDTSIQRSSTGISFRERGLLKDSGFSNTAVATVTGTGEVYQSFNVGSPGSASTPAKLKLLYVSLELFSVEKQLFDYYKSLNNYDEDNPFVEPTPVLSNIKGGLGIFAASGRSTKRVMFK